MEEFIVVVAIILAAIIGLIFGFGGGLDNSKKIYGKQHCVIECKSDVYEVKLDDKFICLCQAR